VTCALVRVRRHALKPARPQPSRLACAGRGQPRPRAAQFRRRACARTGRPSPPGSPCPTVPARYKATSTGSRWSKDKCTGGQPPISCAIGSCSPTSRFTECEPESVFNCRRQYAAAWWAHGPAGVAYDGPGSSQARAS